MLLAAAIPACADDVPNYSVRFDAKSQNLSVRLCLAHAHASVVFDADSEWAMRFVHGVRRDSGRAVTTDDGDWIAADWHAGECLAYRADLGAIVATHERDSGWRLGDDLVTAPQLWLLRPDAQGDVDAQVRVLLPPGWSISTPWHEASVPISDAPAGNGVRFTIPHTPPDWSATVAFGRFNVERIALPGGMLRLSILHGADPQQQEKLRTWLAHVSRAILSAYGRLPVADVQVLMIPVSGHSRAVVFGQHTRGEGNSLQLLIDPSQPAGKFMHDWIAVHELSHLMHPYLGDSGSWLAEGLATYFQNVLRARAGLLTPQQAWDELDDGFKRGQHAADTGTLSEAARSMHRSHAYQRIYWAGAAYWLTVDRDLRRQSHGKLHIDIALSRFRDCCLPAYRSWKPEDFVAKLDSLLDVHTFSQRYREFAAMRKFPDWQKAFKDLGVRDDGGHVTFDNAAPDAKVRDAIMAPGRPQ